MLATLTDTLPLTFRHRQRIVKAQSWSGDGIRFYDSPQSTIRYRFVPCSNTAPRPTMVIVPDPPVMIEHYQDLLELLSKEINILVFEMPGFGFSLPKTSLDMSPLATKDLIAQFLRSANKGPYVLNFPCVAGHVAALLARDCPDLVEGIVFTQTGDKAATLDWKKGVDPRGILSRPVLGQILLRVKRQHVMQGWFRAALSAPEKSPPYTKICDDAFDHGACYCLASALQRFATPALPEVHLTDTPALIIWGDKDKTHRRTQKSNSLQFSSQSEMVLFEDVGHFPDLEDSPRFAQHLLRFTRQF